MQRDSIYSQIETSLIDSYKDRSEEGASPDLRHYDDSGNVIFNSVNRVFRNSPIVPLSPSLSFPKEVSYHDPRDSFQSGQSSWLDSTLFKSQSSIESDMSEDSRLKPGRLTLDPEEYPKKVVTGEYPKRVVTGEHPKRAVSGEKRVVRPFRERPSLDHYRILQSVPLDAITEEESDASVKRAFSLPSIDELQKARNKSQDTCLFSTFVLKRNRRGQFQKRFLSANKDSYGWMARSLYV